MEKYQTGCRENSSVNKYCYIWNDNMVSYKLHVHSSRQLEDFLPFQNAPLRVEDRMTSHDAASGRSFSLCPMVHLNVLSLFSRCKICTSVVYFYYFGRTQTRNEISDYYHFLRREQLDRFRAPGAPNNTHNEEPF